MLHNNSSNRSFESRVLLTLFLIALVRTLLGTVQDLIGEVSWQGILIDSILLCVFTAVTIFAFRNKSFTHIHPLLGVLLVLLISLLFVRSGGVEGSTEYNFFALMVLLSLLYDGRWQRSLLVISFVIVIYLSYSVYVKNSLFYLLFVRNSRGYDNFLYTLVALTILVAYLQMLIEEEDKKLKAKHEELKKKVKLVSIKNVKLSKQQAQLTQMNHQLKQKVEESKAYHEQRNRALQQYIEQHTNKIQLPIQNLHEVIQQVGTPYPYRYQEMLKKSMDDIYKVLDSIKESIYSERQFTITSLPPEQNESKH
ncbi:hypothetical protein OKW21_000359 [Catalinimonas alkaloidigena]|uniref:hypothetical protein n=1 Tax=Catalinimonas alkaloidigena TaxID=1075417 RepID=UPI002404DBF1|nr:hypothetical protein [Catalinimonas alkaloidigena]MDF9795096.1 hypothetical protein [Catalinimonas alkaloidigena]